MAEQRVPVRSEADLIRAREAARSAAEAVGLGRTDLTLLVTAVSEVARNILTYARAGEVHCAVIQRGGRKGVEIVAVDQGPGIPDLESAMTDGFSTGGGLGLGLPGARRLVDDFHIESSAQTGTRVTLVKWGR